jgi:hypothetical protein
MHTCACVWHKRALKSVDWYSLSESVNKKQWLKALQSAEVT